MSDESEAVLPFALKDRWIVTVESERHFVKVRHRTRWYAVARRIGHEERRHWCASRSDALVIAQWQRDAFEQMAEYERFKALYDAAPACKRAEIDAYLATLQNKE
ncbi:MAG: hypothetical protein EPO45_00475 [Sphingobium sp.]|jgi:hypothetical protein|uniref:hypothetical protein n=1 Tax=Sphingobium sp. TaxID=1912891 RepID=UPI000C6A069E|nr:hypothetical protein [Sphingobium sp.]MBA4754526.1 hypothetical protein [Sphingobium sp.]MBS87283.1 hypothetical protein [Sphingobium sp.]MBS87845.1 hypothetical protein [Sphingobium sp.]TAJ81003.1 MAG: hypothetical protein EPO45_00475 [Sphingobium sp.]